MFETILLAFLAINCLWVKAFGQEKDSIFLYNGQVLIGEIQGSNLGTISIDDVDLKMQNVKLYKIKVLKTFQRFKIETVDKKIYYGSLKTFSKNGLVDIITDGGNHISIIMTDIFTMISMQGDFFKGWMGVFPQD
jgi:hypothetical protein